MLELNRRCHGIWDSETATFSPCALPFLSGAAVIIISTIILWHLLYVSNFAKQWRPKWTISFVAEKPPTQAETNWERSHMRLGWSISLLGLSILATAAEIVQIALGGWQLHVVLLLVAWTLASTFILFTRPRTSPTALLPFYLTVFTVETSSIPHWRSPSSVHEASQHIAAFLAFIPVLIILFMPLRSDELSDEGISHVGSPSNNSERSPEDNLALWQFLTYSWVSPIIRIGKKRQLEEGDVWQLAYEFQHRRLHEKFRVLRGSVLRRLLQANGIDCYILVVTAIIQLLCEFANPLLLQQLLLAMERPDRQNTVAITYALVLWVSRIISAQTAVISMWFARRVYERSRGEMILMVYEKALSRKVIIGHDEKKESTATNANGHAAENGTVNAESNDDSNGNTNGAAKPTSKDPPKPEPEVIRLFKNLFMGRKTPKAKDEGAASAGKVLNIIRGDVYEISLRFYEIGSMLKIPLRLFISIWLIWTLLGPSCFFAVLSIFIAQALNAALTRLQVRWRKYLKEARDARINANSQYLEVLRYLRWYSWQDYWLQGVTEARRHELNVRVIVMFLNLMIYFINMAVLGLFPVAAFFAYTVLAHNTLRIDIIFSALQLFNILQSALREIPTTINTLLNAYVAMTRIEEFMAEPEKAGKTPSPLIPNNIRLDSCSFSWPGSSTSVLRDVTLTVEQGLTVVHGKVGSGKTAFLLALLGEMDQTAGTMEIANQMIGYCSQTPWLQSMSIRESILFFSPYEEDRYQKVLEACALLPDLANFKHGDESLIGENGIGLSGGQKARVSLARAMYSRSRILLLDDPISALDHDTAEHAVKNCFAGSLIEGRSVILATHRTHLVHHLADRFFEVVNGHITQTNGLSEKSSPDTSEPVSDDDSTLSNGGNKKDDPKDPPPNKFFDDEHRESGSIKVKVWWTYFKAGTLRWWAVLALMIAMMRVITVGGNWFYKVWGEAYDEFGTTFAVMVQEAEGFGAKWHSLRNSNNTVVENSLLFAQSLPPPAQNPKPWLLILLAISMGQSISLLLYGLAQQTVVFFASKNLFNDIMARITYASFRFYDTTPTGRLMNRLTSDIGVIDSALHYFGQIIFAGSSWIAAVIVIASVTPLFLVFSIFLMALFVMIFLQYLPASQNLRRLEKTSLSPLFANFGELLQGQGLATVRAFCAQQLFQDRVIAVVDQFQSMDHFYWSCQNWLMYRYENLSAVSTFVLTAMALSINLSPGLTAFMLVNVTHFVTSTHTLCKRYGEMQMEFVSVERAVELLEVEQEPQGTEQPPAAWPAFGSDIVFDNVTVRYAPELDPSLRDITLRIPGGSTTAVIGRTGSGKSTLATALLNIVRADQGAIYLDGIPLTSISVKTLRERLTFVSQDPVLFAGTIRHNLDPTSEFTDTECTAVLDRICAKQNWTLDTKIESGGQNLSQGQRQLIGITRAVLRRSPIIILDEATASIDLEASMELQAILRQEMKESTVITIAHRVEAVNDADYVVVLENGRVLREGPVGDVVG